VITFAIYAFECVRTQFPLFGLESGKVQFKVCLAAPDYVSVIFDFMRATIFLTSGPMSLACEDSVSLFPTVMTLRYSRIHICSSNGGDKPAIVERVVD